MALDVEDLEPIARVIVDPMVSAFREGFDRLDSRLVQTNERLDLLTGRVEVLTERVDVLTERVDVFTDRMDVLTGEVRHLQKRVDQVVENTGAHWRDHEERLRRLETLGITKKNGGGNGTDSGN